MDITRELEQIKTQIPFGDLPTITARLDALERCQTMAQGSEPQPTRPPGPVHVEVTDDQIADALERLGGQIDSDAAELLKKRTITIADLCRAKYEADTKTTWTGRFNEGKINGYKANGGRKQIYLYTYSVVLFVNGVDDPYLSPTNWSTQ